MPLCLAGTTYPLMMAVRFHTPLLVYGENVSYEYGGSDAKETYSAKEQLSNGVATGIDEQELIDNTGVTGKDLYLTRAPKQEELDKMEYSEVPEFAEQIVLVVFSSYNIDSFHSFYHCCAS